MDESKKEETGFRPVPHSVKRVQRSMGAGEIGIPVSPRDLGAVCGYHGDLIG